MEAREEGGRRQPESPRPVVGTPSTCGLWLLGLCHHPGVPIPHRAGLEGRWEEPSPSPRDARPLGCRQGGRAEDLQGLVWERGDGQVQVYLVDWRAQAAMHR